MSYGTQHSLSIPLFEVSGNLNRHLRMKETEDMWKNKVAFPVGVSHLFFVLAVVNPAVASDGLSNVVISEFMASNVTAMMDGDGEFSDWIEIHNPTDQAININSWYLTDDLSELTQWRFPSSDTLDLTVASGGRLLVFASGKQTSEGLYLDSKSYLHCDFKLQSSGEDLALVQSDGTTIVHEYAGYARQFSDISYGVSETSGGLGYFTVPTPEAPNSSLYFGIVGDTHFSIDRGFHEEPFDLEITTDLAEATIRYTLDGSEPDEDHGIIYMAPIRIGNTTTLRAAAFKENYISSNVDTHTYLFVSDVIVQSPTGAAPNENWPDPETISSGGDNPGPGGPGRPGNPGGGGSSSSQVIDYGMDPDVVEDPRYSSLMVDAMLAIPSLSIVTALDNLFDTSTGIYVNAQQYGIDWERPASLELINPDGSEGFQIDAGLRIRGGVSRSGSNPKHSFRVIFRSEYGNAKLKFPLFEEEGVDEFDKIDLRTGQNFSWSFSSAENATWLYDVFTRDTEGAMGKPYTRSRFYHLYINGCYWGLYQTDERPESNYAASYLGGDEDDYDVIKADNDDGSIYAVDGNLTAYQALWSEINSGITDNVDYFRLQGLDEDGLARISEYPKYLDVDNLIDFMLVIYYTGNRDCPLGPPGSDNRPRNLYGVFNRENPNGFQFITHDNEWTLLAGQSSSRSGESSDLYINRVNASLSSSLSLESYFNPWWMHNRLMTDNSEYRLRFADHVYKHFFNGGVLIAANCASRFEARKNKIDLAIIAESARWGDCLTPNDPRTKDDDWLVIVNKNLNDYILASPSTRTEIVFSQIKAKGWYPDLEPPAFNQYGGKITAGFALTMTAPEGNIFYTLDGSDPRLPGGELDPEVMVYTGEPVILDRSTRIMARAYSENEWSPLADASFDVAGTIGQYLRITEIHYHPLSPTESEIAAGFDDQDDFEFIELMNTSDELTLNLSGVQFADGIDFGFDSDDVPSLGPQEYLLFVYNRLAFEFRYGEGYAVYGEYSGHLNNAGERIEITDSEGGSILTFEYDDADPWPEEPDGDGPSLQVIDVNGDYNDPANWRASNDIGGNPALAPELPASVDSWGIH